MQVRGWAARTEKKSRRIRTMESGRSAKTSAKQSFLDYMRHLSESHSKMDMKRSGKSELLLYTSSCLEKQPYISVFRYKRATELELIEIRREFEQDRSGYAKLADVISQQMSSLLKVTVAVKLVDFTVDWICPTVGLVFMGALFATGFPRFITMIYRMQTTSSFVLLATFEMTENLVDQNKDQLEKALSTWNKFVKFRENSLKHELVFHPASVFFDITDEDKSDLFSSIVAAPFCFKIIPLTCLPDIVVQQDAQSALVP